MLDFHNGKSQNESLFSISVWISNTNTFSIQIAAVKWQCLILKHAKQNLILPKNLAVHFLYNTQLSFFYDKNVWKNINSYDIAFVFC